MSVLGTLVVRIAAENAKYKADINEAAKDTQNAAATIETATGRVSAAAATAAEKVAQSIDKQIRALQQQVETFGMSSREATVYKLAMEGATEAQKKQADTALKQVESLQAARDMGEQVGSAIKTGALLAAAGVAAAAYAFESLIGNISKYQDLAEQTGGDPAGLASLRTAADVGGASIESLIASANRMQNSLSKVDDESKGVGRALAAIGIRVEDFKKLRADEQLRMVAQSLNQYADGGSKVAVVQAILGRGAASLLPALKELGNETEANNRLTKEQIQLADDYKDAQARSKSELIQFAERMAIEALPAVTEFNGAVKDTISELIGAGSASTEFGKNKSIQEFAGNGAILLANLADIAYDAAGAFRFVGDNLGAMAAISVALAHGDLAGARAIGKASDEQNERILKGLGLAEKVQARIDAMNAKSTAAAEKYKDPRILGEVGSIADQTKKNIDYHAAEIKAVHTKISAYDRLMKSISEKTAADQMDMQGQGNLTAGQKEAVKIMDDLRTGTLKLTESEKIKLTTALESRLATEQEKLSINALAKVQEEARKQSAAYFDGLAKGLATQSADNEKLREHLQEIGLTTEALGALRMARLDAAIAQEEETYTMLDAHEASAGELLMLKERIQLLKEQRSLTGQIVIREVGVETAKKVNEEWQRGWEETDRTARDAFTGWATKGESAAEAIGGALKKALLSAIYEATFKPIAFQIYASVTGGSQGAGGAAGGVMGAANAASGLSNLASMGGAAFQYATGSLAGASAASMGAANAIGALGGDSLGALIAGNGGWAGVSTAAAAGEVGALGTAAGAGSGFMAGLSTVAPYALGALALMSMIGGNGGTPSVNTGNASMSFDAEGNQTAYQTYFGGSNAATDSVITGMQASYSSAAKALGITVADSHFQFGANSGGSTSPARFALGGGVGSSSFYQAETDRSDAAIQLAASRAVFAALKGSELPKYLAGAFDSLTVESMTQEQITATLNGAAALKTFHDQLELLPFENLKDLSYSATQGLLTFSGGLDKFSANLGTYYTNFYSAEEQKAQIIKNINATLEGSGFDAATATRDQFRALVDAQDVTTESGQKMYAALLSVSGAFAGITQSSDDLATSLKAAANSIFDEVTRIRGLISASGSDSYAQAQTRFTIASAQARAGDQDAAKLLPSLSQALLTLAESNAVSLADLQRIRGLTAGSLETTGNLITGGGVLAPSAPDAWISDGRPGDMITQQDIPKAFAPQSTGIVDAFIGGSTERLEALVQTLTDEVANLRYETRATAEHAAKTSRILARVTRDGESMQTVAA